MTTVVLWSLTLLATACTEVSGDRILGRDLKLASPGFEVLADDSVVAPAPAPGVERRFTTHDLQRFGSPVGDLCFVRSAQPLDRELLTAALQLSLAGRDVTIEITDFSAGRYPAGTLQFPLAGLPGTARVERAGTTPAPVIWRGALRAEAGRTIPVWAAVRLLEMQSWVEAKEPLALGVPVSENQVQVRSARRPINGQVRNSPPALFLGKVPRRPIAAGTPLSPEMFAEPQLVVRGDPVEVEVASGAILLKFPGRAETAGKLNQQILVLDPVSRRHMFARVAGRGKVIVDASPKDGNNAASSEPGDGRTGPSS